jgi:hypothetical protein
MTTWLDYSLASCLVPHEKGVRFDRSRLEQALYDAFADAAHLEETRLRTTGGAASAVSSTGAGAKDFAVAGLTASSSSSSSATSSAATGSPSPSGKRSAGAARSSAAAQQIEAKSKAGKPATGDSFLSVEEERKKILLGLAKVCACYAICCP